MIKRWLDNLKWDEGRQKSGYKKIKLLESKRFLFDMYLLYYPEGSAIASHVDNINFGNHYRLNYTIKKAKKGGIFLLAGRPIFRLGRLVIFRPDKQYHSVSQIKKGYRIVFSFGWARKNKQHGTTT
jgi:hypothetical protein